MTCLDLVSLENLERGEPLVVVALCCVAGRGRPTVNPRQFFYSSPYRGKHVGIGMIGKHFTISNGKLCVEN
jgi:hypothetical protein